MTIHPDNSVTVRDAGAGIPVDVIAEQGLPALTVVLTKLHAGGKFGGEGYKVSGGLHGVGVSVVNALSEWLVAEVRRDGKVYRQEFARGEPSGDMETIGVSKKDESGTVIAFLPDPDVFEETEFSAATLSQRLRAFAALGERLEHRVGFGRRRGDARAGTKPRHHLKPRRVEIGEHRVFVRDRGRGFDTASVPRDRGGIAESVTGRVQRNGGTAVVRSACGRGTEVELTMRRARA